MRGVCHQSRVKNSLYGSTSTNSLAYLKPYSFFNNRTYICTVIPCNSISPRLCNPKLGITRNKCSPPAHSKNGAKDRIRDINVFRLLPSLPVFLLLHHVLQYLQPLLRNSNGVFHVPLTDFLFPELGFHVLTRRRLRAHLFLLLQPSLRNI